MEGRSIPAVRGVSSDRKETKKFGEVVRAVPCPVLPRRLFYILPRKTQKKEKAVQAMASRTAFNPTYYEKAGGVSLGTTAPHNRHR